MIKERVTGHVPGIPVLVVSAGAVLGSPVAFAYRVVDRDAPGALVAAAIFVVALVVLVGLTPVSPNEGRVLQLFGRYAGTVREPGLWWVNPFIFPRRRVSLRVRNFESAHLK